MDGRARQLVLVEYIRRWRLFGQLARLIVQLEFGAAHLVACRAHDRAAMQPAARFNANRNLLARVIAFVAVVCDLFRQKWDNYFQIQRWIWRVSLTRICKRPMAHLYL